MPSRIVREGILTSEAVNSLSPGAELFYRRLMSVVDDYGRYEAHPAILLPACYPRQLDKVSISMLAEWLTECAQAVSTETDDPLPLVSIYTVKGKKYLQINRFEQRTRTPSKWPDPPKATVTGKLPTSVQHEDRHVDSQSDRHRDRHLAPPARGRSESESESESPPIGPPPGGMSGFSLTPKPTADPPGPPPKRKRREPPDMTAWKAAKFDEFWAAVWSREGKQPALTEWARQVQTPAEADRIIAACKAVADRERAKGQRNNGTYLHPRTWLHQRRFDDEGPPPALAVVPPPPPQDNPSEHYPDFPFDELYGEPNGSA